MPVTRDTRSITNARRIAFGPSDRLMSMATIKYPFAIDVYTRMENNAWSSKIVAMGPDKDQYRRPLGQQGALSDAERRAYDKALAFVSGLDGIQFNNLIQNIGSCITAPEVNLAIARQAAEEGLHVRAYQLMIEAVSLDPEEVYMQFETDGMLAAKNAYIMGQSDLLRDDKTHEAFARAVIGNILLEGVHFYPAFLLFYVLAKNGKMSGSADVIKYIQRDEGGTHLDLFQNIHGAHKQENEGCYQADFWRDAERLFRDAVELEVKWGGYLVGNGIPGLTPQMFPPFVQDLANKQWARLGRTVPLYPGVVTSVPWFEQFSQVNGERVNFFEGKPSDYVVGGLDW